MANEQVLMVSTLDAAVLPSSSVERSKGIYLPIGKQDSSSGMDSSSVTDHMYNS